jgi:hypothetical protein
MVASESSMSSLGTQGRKRLQMSIRYVHLTPVRANMVEIKVNDNI